MERGTPNVEPAKKKPPLSVVHSGVSPLNKYNEIAQRLGICQHNFQMKGLTMRVKTHTTSYVLSALNSPKELKQKSELVFFDDEYWTPLYMLDTDYDYEPGTVIEVGIETSSISPSDLSDESKIESDDECTVFRDFILESVSPYTDGDWEFKDIFNPKELGLLNDLLEKLHETTLEFVGKYPQILSEDPNGFFKINKSKKFVLRRDGRWELATEEDVKLHQYELEKYQIAWKEKQAKREEILSKLTPEERELLES